MKNQGQRVHNDNLAVSKVVEPKHKGESEHKSKCKRRVLDVLHGFSVLEYLKNSIANLNSLVYSIHINDYRGVCRHGLAELYYKGIAFIFTHFFQFFLCISTYYA